MAGDVYLVRHELCVLGEKRHLNGPIDSDLCEAGRERAEARAPEIGNLVLGREIFVCSTGLKRTIQTAMPFARHMGVDSFPQYAELNERDLGEFTGLHIDDALARVEDPSHITWAGGIPYVEMEEPYKCESFASVRERVRPIAHEFRDLKRQGKVVFAFIHGDSGRLTAAEYHDVPTSAVLDTPFPNGGIWHLTDDGIRPITLAA